MGQTQTSPWKQYEKQYTIASRNQNDELLVRHKTNGKQFMLRKIMVKSQQQLQETMNLLSKRKKLKSQHLLNVIDFKPINQDRICGTVTYISLLIQYPFQSLLFETIHRLTHLQTSSKASTNNTNRFLPLYFQEHELWSILYSCVLGLQVLYLSDLTHESIAKDIIFIDKEGVVKIGDPIIIGARKNFQRVIQSIQHQKNKREGNPSSKQSSPRSNFSTGDKNQTYLKRLNRIKQSKVQQNPNQEQPSPRSNQNGQINQQSPAQKLYSTSQSALIVSPELISLCKDPYHQYYYFDKEKSEVFLVMLDNIASVNIKQSMFRKDFGEFFGEGGKLRQKLSTVFANLIQNMTDLDPKQRPTLSQIIQKIQQFSIQQNTNSDRNSILNRSIDFGNVSNNKNVPNNNCHLPTERPLNFNSTASYLNNLPYYQEKQFASATFIQPSSLLPFSGNNFINGTSTVPLNVGSAFNHFPSFSINSDPKPLTSTNFYQQSAVKSLFSKNMPMQIKYTQSPLTLPVSSVQPLPKEKRFQSLNFSTPFHNLNLTQSNQKKKTGKQIQMQSIVQNKFSLFGGNNFNGYKIFQKVNKNQPKEDHLETGRFSLNNFGKIQLSNNSNTNSGHTSMIPTPRFENSFIPQTTFHDNQVTKPQFKSNFLTPIEYMHSNLPSTSNYANLNLNLNTNQFNIQKINAKETHSIGSGYNAKKQGFSINDYQIQQNNPNNLKSQPYFTNSSVGYTLSKYRPESSFSQIVMVRPNQLIKNSDSRQNIAVKKTNVFVGKDNQTYESFVQKAGSPIQERHLNRYNSSASSMINAIQRLGNDKSETYSNTSSQNTVKKQNTSSKRNSNQKKYNFYKKQMNQKLQRIEQPIKQQQSQMSSIQMIDERSQQRHQYSHQNLYSPINRQVFASQEMVSSHSDNSITPVTFQPKLHSVYVQEKQQKGSFYRGQKLDNQRHGSGVLTFADSGFYEGQFNHDEMQGYGKLYYNQKDLAYQGQFFKGSFHGHGVLYNNDPKALQTKFDFANLNNVDNYWKIYDGYFKEDQKVGKCHIIFTNGEEFEGYCQNNTFEGNGRFKTIDGQYIDGVWKNNVLVEVKNQGKIQELRN